MNILIVGNGFDLAHGLPTRYTDFMTFLRLAEELYNAGDMKSIDSYLYRRSHEYIQKYLLDVSYSRDKLETIMSFIANNVWYRYFTYVLEGNYSIGKNWIDFESEIRKIVEYFDRQTSDIYAVVKRPFKENPEIEEFYSIYVACVSLDYDTTYKDFIDKTYYDLQRLTECLEFYLRQCVDRVTMHGSTSRCRLRSADIMNIDADAVLSFNYTNTYGNLYHSPKTYSMHFIHGNVGSGTSGKGNDMVLGVDEYWDGEEKNYRVNFNLFKKFVQRILKDTGIEYKKWLAEANVIPSKKYISYEPSINNVYIFGHSLDITDKDILSEIITSPGITSTTVFYRSKQQQAEQIANLSKILGQNTLLEYVNSVNPKIIFKKQQDMVSIPDEKE
jgi:hypothetical protein